MSILKCRRTGLVCALVTWGACLVVTTILGSVQKNAANQRACLSSARTVEGALEMYMLDHNVKPVDVLLKLQPTPGAFFKTLVDEGYLSQLPSCPAKDAFLFVPVHQKSWSSIECRCTAHPGSVAERYSAQDGGTWMENSEIANFVDVFAGLAAWVVFPVAFWIVVCLRSHRYSLTAKGRTLPFSWVMIVNALFAPAGLLAMGLNRNAAWQFLLMAGVHLTIPSSFLWTFVITTVWTAFAWKRLHRAGASSPLSLSE